MKYYGSGAILGALLLAVFLSTPHVEHPQNPPVFAGDRPARKNPPEADGLLARLPMTFEPNRSQVDSRVQFLARGSGYSVFLTSGSSATMTFRPANAGSTPDRLVLSFKGANRAAAAVPDEATGGVTNYYRGSDRSRWIEGVPNYRKVRYQEVYPGIDVVYQGDNGRFRYDFIVKPGADPKSIRLSYEGLRALRLNQDGDAVVSLASGALTASKPVIYQDTGRGRRTIDGSYLLRSAHELAFQVSDYDKSNPLVIDPGNTYATYFGGSAFQTQITSIATDSASIYFAGWTTATSFDPALAFGTDDAFLAVADAGLTTVNQTFFGGTANDEAYGIAVNGSRIVVAGSTTSGASFPATGQIKLQNPSAVNANQHAFVAAFTKAGVFSLGSVLAGAGTEQVNGVAIDTAGRIHMAGSTGSPDLLTNIQAPPTSAQSRMLSQTGTNAFYIVLPPTMDSIAYASYLGGWNSDSAAAVAVDSLGNGYITGSSTSWGTAPVNSHSFPSQWPMACAGGNTVGCMPASAPILNPYSFSSGKHAFVAMFNPGGANSPSSPTLLYALPVGGDLNPNESDAGTAIAVDSQFNVYIGGNTSSPGFGSVGGVLSGTPGTNGSANNVVFTAPGSGIAGASGAGPGVIASVILTNSGTGYSVGQALIFSLPDLPSGHVAQAVVSGTTGNGTIASIQITNQGAGYTTPPSVVFPPPAQGGTTATGTAVAGFVVLGKPTNGGQDGWVIALNTPGSLTATLNGTGLGGSPAAVSAPFPGVLLATLVNGDEVNGNGTGVGTLPSGATNQVTGIATDSGVTPAAPGASGGEGNIYIAGSVTNSSFSFPALIRRRLNTGGMDPANPTNPLSPFLRQSAWPAGQNGPVTAVGDILLTTAIPGATNIASAVAYDPGSGRSCIATNISQGLPAAASSMLNSAAVANYPGGTVDGAVFCAPFQSDTRLSSTVVNFTMQAGATQASPAPFTPLSAANTANQATLTVSNPNNLPQTFTIGAVFYTPGGITGPQSAAHGATPWLNVSTGGSGVIVSLLNQSQLSNPSFVNSASYLDPGFYQATFTVTPTSAGSADNANVPQVVTVNLTVTSSVQVNTTAGGGVTANLTVQVYSGGGFGDIGNNTKYINIPVASVAPAGSPSVDDAVFDVQRDANNNPVFLNSNTTYPVLGPPSLLGTVSGLTLTNNGSGYTPNSTGALIFSPPAGTGTTAAGTFTVGPAGSVVSFLITNPGSGYSNPPSVQFPLPGAGGKQAQATVSIAGSPNTTAGGSVTIRPAANLAGGTIGCGQTRLSPNSAQAMSNANACYIQLALPPNMMAGAPPGTYTGAFKIVIPAGTPNSPSGANEGSAITVAQTTVTITAIVASGSSGGNGGVCTLALTTGSSSLSSTGTSTGGLYPSTPITLTVSAPNCPSWTATSSDPTFLSILSGASGSGIGTVSFNAFANTHLSSRSGTIKVTAGTLSQTYTVTEAASTETQLQREVRALYQRVLGREPDSAGFSYWTCLTPGTVNPCANLGLSGLGQMVDSFLTSPEGMNTDFQVLAIFQSVLGRYPSYAEWTAAIGPFLQNNTPSGWISAGMALSNTLVHSSEFANKYGSTMFPGDIILTLYRNSLNQPPTVAQLVTGDVALASGANTSTYSLLFNIWGTSPAGLNLALPPSQTFTNPVYRNNTNGHFVYLLYYAILARDVDAPGLNFWVSTANGGGPGIYFINPGMRLQMEGPGTPGAGFVGSPEFQGLFNN